MIDRLLQPVVIYALAGALVASGVFGLYQWGESAALRVELATLKRDAALATAAAQAAARARESQHALELSLIAERYEKDKRDAIQVERGVVADLRADNLRLRKHWQGCPTGVPQAGSAAAGRDDDAELRAAAAGAIVRIGAEADAALRACQAVIRADRE